MSQNVVKYADLDKAELFVDCLYEGGPTNNAASEVLPKLLPKCGIMSGFRKIKRKDNSGKMAYVVLYTTMTELEWPDYLDKETGIFRYYGDNRTPGKNILNTKLGGNKLLEEVFGLLNSNSYDDIPPFLLFKGTGKGRDVQFLGLAAPGNPKISPDHDLVSFWRMQNDSRFQNYEAYFTVLDTGDKPVSKKWLKALIEDHANSLQYAPDCWKRFVKRGRNGITPLKAPKILTIPDKYSQLQNNVEGNIILSSIRNHYSSNPYGFEACATEIIKKMDNNFSDFELTRPWRDGGRDAIGFYLIDSPGKANSKLKIDCALEAKCYSENNGVGVKQMSRLISRIRYRQFGILTTTSYVDNQAYKEVVEDGHPVLIVTASDIGEILIKNQINSGNVDDWLKEIDITYANR